MTAETKPNQKKSARGKTGSTSGGAASPKRARTTPSSRAPAGVTASQQAEVLAALKETLLDITQGISLPDLLQAIVKRAVKLLNASGGGLYLNEPDRRQVRCAVSYKTMRDYSGTILAYGEGASGRVAQTGKPLMIDDYASWSGRAAAYEEERPFRAVICAPMKWQGHLTGVMTILREKKFSRADLNLLTLFADHASVAVENARLHQSIDRELSERERAEIALRDSEEQFHDLFANMAEGYAFCKMIYAGGKPVDWIYLAVNPAFETLTGLKNITGKRVTEAIPNIRETDPELFRIYGRVVRTGKPEKFEAYVEALEMWFSVSVHRPKKGHFLAMFDVITERKRAEAASQENERRFRALFEQSNDAVFIINLEGRHIAANQRAADMFGFTRDEILSLGLSDLSAEPVASRDVFKRVIAGERIPLYERKFRKKNGEIFPVEVNLELVCDADGKPMHVQSILRGIAERKLAEASLREAEAKYRELVERLPLVVYTAEVGSSGRWHYISPRIKELLGFTAEEWTADPDLWFHQMHPQDRDAHQAVEEQSLASNMVFEDEYRIFTKDGRQVWVRDSGIIHPSVSGQVPIVQGVLIDVTERREIEDALRESEQRYRLLVDSSPSAIALHQNGKIVFVNEAAVRLMRAKSPEDLIGKPVMELVHPDYRQIVAERVRKAIEENKPGATIEEKFLRLDGTAVDVDVSSASLIYRGMPAVQVIVHDITERKRSEDALRLAEEKYRNLVEQAPEVVYLDYADTSSKNFYISPQVESLLGYPPSAFVEDPLLWHRLVFPDDYFTATKTIENTLTQGRDMVEYRLIARDGHIVWVRDTSVLLSDESGNPTFIQGFLEDITEQKRAENLQQSLYEIARAGMTTQSLDELYAKIHSILQKLLPTQFFYIAIYDREHDIISFPYFQDAYDEAPAPSKPGRGLTEYVLRTRLPTLATPEVTDRLVHAGEIELVGADSIEWLGVPLLVQDEAIGVMVVQSYDETVHFSARDMEVMTYVSTQVASAIERKRAEEALKRSEGFASSIIKNEPECVKIVGPGGTLQYMNPAGLEMIEVDDLEKVRGKSVYPIVVPEHRAAFMDLTERVLRGESGTLQFEIVGLAGTRRWLDTQAVPLYDEQGNVESLLGITRDITEQRQAVALQDAVYRITKAAETTESVHDLFPQIHQIISSVMPAENFFITLYDEARNVLEFPYFKDVLDEPYLESIEPGMGLTAYVLRTGKSLLCTQAVHDELERQGAVKLLGVPSKIWLGVPLIVEGRTIGVMVVQHYTDPDAYGEREQNILEFVSSQIAVTIQRKQSEQALRESEARYRAIIEQATEGMVIYNLGTLQVLDANPAYQKLLGYTAAEMSELTLYDIAAHDHANIDFLVERIREERQVWVGERHHRRKDGSVANVEVSGSIIVFRGQEALLVVVRDITERKKAEEELQKSEDRFRTLVNGMLDGVYSSTHEGRFIDVNPAMVRLFGYASREEMLQIDIRKDLYFAPGDRESLFLDTGQEKTDVFRMKRKDGSEIWVEDHGRYLHDEAGNVTVHEGILRDVTERIRAEREIGRLLQESQQRLRHVEALRSVDLAIGSSMDLRTTLNILLSYVKSLLAVDAADILLFNRNSQSFEFVAGTGFRSRVSETTYKAMGRSFASRVALERRIVQFHNPPEAHANRELSALWKAEGLVTYTGVPLIAKGDLKGVLEIHHRSLFHAETAWMDLVQNFSTQAAIAVENAQLFNDLQNTNFELSLAYDATIEGWSRALELRENEPPGHFQRVTDMTLALARAMGVRDADLIHVRRGALLHDIGKMAIPDSILRKTGPLNDEEWKIMHEHPIHARELLGHIAYLRPALDIPCHHHEKWDGTGYPAGLKGEEIPLAARVFALADVYDASTSDRFHRKGLSKEKALEYIKSQSGKHFDPSVVGAFMQLILKGELSL